MAKILRVIESLNPKKGGPAYSTLQSSIELAKNGHKVTIVTLDTRDRIYCPTNNIEIVNLGPGLLSYGLSCKLFFWLNKNCKKFDLVTIHGIWQWPSLSFRISRSKKTKFIVMPHGSLDVWDRNKRPFNFLFKKIYWNIIERPLYKNAAACLFTSSDEMNNSKRQFNLDGIKISLTPYGVPDTNNFRSELSGGDSYNFGYMGRIHEKKGIEILIDSLSYLIKIGINAKLTITGSGEAIYIEKLQKKAELQGVKNHIKWTGPLHGKEKEEMLKSIGLFVLPSYQENFGLAVAEALSAGTPCLLSTAVNIHREVVSHDSGMATERNVESFSNQMKLWSQGFYENKISRKNARECYINNFSISSFTRKIESYL